MSCACAPRRKAADFFFSSRRRHTRWTGDWSSDVCSSDLLAGQDLDWTPAIALRDNISTDEITPAYICYYYDETLGDFPYLGLKCGEEFPITRGSVKRGGFVASVSGQRRGKGSAREQSPYAEMCAGIKLVVAENIERIYRENCQNL